MLEWRFKYKASEAGIELHLLQPEVDKYTQTHDRAQRGHIRRLAREHLAELPCCQNIHARLLQLPRPLKEVFYCQSVQFN